MAVVLSRSITTPLQALVVATRKIAQGDLNQQVPIQSHDELAVLAQSFNEMTSRLQQTLSLLQAHKDELEQRVQERTQALSEAIQHLQQTQTQLVQSEKMSSLGQLVAGVAHEINNPASFIHGNLTYASTYIQDLLDIITLYQQHYPNPPAGLQEAIDAVDLAFIQSDLPKLLQSMQVGSDRINEIVRSLRTFSRLEEGDFKPADIHDGIDSTLMILKHRLKMATGNGIQVVKHYAPLDPIDCRLGQLNQVFMNILTNAIDALQDQGAAPSSPSQQPPTIEIRTRSLSPDWIAIHIFNNGPSIDTEIHSKLFDPFFTTKSVGQGTGLGLSISYQIVTEHHRGRLYCHSKANWGTEFILELPTHHPDETMPDLAAADH
ncbi:sensor histidine kinase [Halomicronema hongdechloris]|uniref:sensor histidine kinase n=1 Tax=Halomicronema hongdechloris TaxID=1209493 RepID=UPI00211ABCA2|nr:ATP-binding protein [Halomicronema hongdechloris]